jgi:hypothetical protein
MTSTIETNNSNILKKIECLNNICDYMSKTGKYSNEIIIKSREQINDLFNKYSLESAIILSDYFSLLGTNENAKEKEQYNKLYHRYIKSNNIAATLDSIYNNLRKCFTSEKMPDLFENTKFAARLQKEGNIIFSEYNKIKIHIYVEEVKTSNLCPICKEPMMITSPGEQSCSKCGRCQDAIITIIDDDGVSNDSKNSKYATYDPSKHCREWLDRIQGREIADMREVEKIVECIKNQLAQDRIKNVDYITYTLIRNYLHKNNKSCFNEHIPLIRKMITGISPPQLSEAELQKVNIYFIRIIKLYYAVKPSSKINCPYHPYIIYKILEQIMQNGNRKSAILKCIHLQSSQTLIQNDRIWKKICEHIPEFTYLPTDRNRQ